jgi:hypothetical protein
MRPMALELPGDPTTASHLRGAASTYSAVVAGSGAAR